MTDPARVSFFVTGGTGLLGRHLVDRLALRGHDLFVLVRKGARARFAQRLDGWRRAAEAAGGSVRLLDGDITHVGLGLSHTDRAHLQGLHHVLHLAALYDLGADKARLHAVNVDGTRHVLELLREVGFAGVLHHCSSVAVAGDHAGVFSESDLDVGQRHPHPYLRTKFEAERLVREASDLRVRIYRPSAIVGDSRTGEIDRVDGLYYLFKPIQRVRDALPRWFPVVGLTNDPINLVPVDWVADVLDRLAHTEGLDGRTFHVVDPEPPPFRTTYNAIADAAAAPRMGRVLGSSLLRRIPPQAAMAAQLASVRFLKEELLGALRIPTQVPSAVNRKVRFDTSNLRAALAGTLPCPPQTTYLERLWDYWARNLDPDRDVHRKRREAFAGKHVLVTGASSGIGRDVALLCAELGATTILVARRDKELAEVAAAVAESGGQSAYYTADLSDPADCDRVLAAIHAAHGHVDVLVNNAGRSIRRPAAQSIERFHDYERTMQLNFFGALRMIRGCLPKMRERRSGAIVNVLSAGTRMPSPNFSAYMASKAALASLTDTLAAELLSDGIHCAGIYLPWVRTEMMGKAFEANTDVMTAHRAAEWIVDAVTDRKRDMVPSAATRRFVVNLLAPGPLTRLLNVVWRISTDEDGANPEFAMDRMVAKRFIKGRMM